MRKRLLIFDLNGIFLVREKGDVGDKPDFTVNGRKCFVRPGVTKFLKWVHHHFDVAVWSSTMPHNTIPIVKNIWKKKVGELKFVWNQNDCTEVGTFEDGKPIFLKELNFVWERHLNYDSGNTLLIDDDPYKVETNPMHTSIHPPSLTFETRNNSIDFLRPYLERLLESPATVPEFVACTREEFNM